MMYSISTFAVLGLAAITNAHMVMNTPVPFGKSSLNNSPLNNTGIDFPCKQRPGVYEAEGASNSMAVGSTQPLKFTGGATHGGGSCQISITYDKAPTKNSVFKVIHSIVGGCPVQGVAGNVGDDANAPSPTEYTFPVPDFLPAGDAVLAWTWFNKVGNREMYMNCAPVTLTSGTKGGDMAAYNALPNMFTANIANIGSDYGTLEDFNVIFPDPGDSVTSMGTGTGTTVYLPPIHKATGAAAGGGASGAPAATATFAPIASASTKAPPPGGVFATVPPSKATGSPSASAPVGSPPVASSAVASAKPTTLVTSVAASKAPSGSNTSSASIPASTGTTGTGSAIAAGTACTTEGIWNCIGGTSFQQCASGTWSAVQQMASGMSCAAGESTTLSMKAVGAKPKRAQHFSA